MTDTAKHSVLFVCLGNICRSPMAEIVFRHMVKEHQVEHEWHIDSAGTAGYHTGDSPDSRTLKVCRKHFGVIDDDLQARQLNKKDFNRFEYILTMDESNLQNINRVKPKDSTAIIKLLGSFDPLQVNNGIVEDPYYGGDDGFEVNFQQCTRALTNFLSQNP
jgi:low molecular weight phosphotyrosine protein phosphatase